MLSRHVAKDWGLTKSIIPSTSWRIFFNAWMKLTWQRRIQWLQIQFDVKALIHAHTLEVSHHRQKKHTSFDFRKSLNKYHGPPEDWTSNFENLRIGVIVLQNWKSFNFMIFCNTLTRQSHLCKNPISLYMRDPVLPWRVNVDNDAKKW